MNSNRGGEGSEPALRRRNERRAAEVPTAGTDDSSLEVAKVEESCAGPTLLVLGVAVREWFGTIHNDEAHRLAAELNRRATERATQGSNHDDVQDAAQGER